MKKLAIVLIILVVVIAVVVFAMRDSPALGPKPPQKTVPSKVLGTVPVQDAKQNQQVFNTFFSGSSK